MGDKRAVRIGMNVFVFRMITGKKRVNDAVALGINEKFVAETD